MKSDAPPLHMILGSIAAMLVSFLALFNGTSPVTCLMKAAAAFLVFAGFGLILRYALADALAKAAEEKEAAGMSGIGGAHGMSGLDVIVPGTSVADLLATHTPPEEPDMFASEEDEDDRAVA